MATVEPELRPSLLDRLIDADPDSSVDPPRADAELRREIVAAIQHDVDQILNTRSWLGTWPPELDRIRGTILNCGLPDTTGIAIDSEPIRKVLTQTIRMALETFEPRLRNVNVAVMAGVGARTARVVIRAEVPGSAEPLLLGRVVGRSRLVDLTKGRT
jgi:type VI secretion system protein ImpF